MNPLAFQEYWFLDTAVTSLIPLRSVVGPEVSLRFNKPDHRLSNKQVVELLERLCRRGWIFFARTGSSVPIPDVDIRIIENALVENLPNEQRLVYGLTDQGGTLWEDASRPIWPLFWESLSDGQTTLYRTCNRHFINLIADARAQVSPSTATPAAAQPIAPFEATYWKRVSEGYELSLPELTDDPIVRLLGEWYQRPTLPHRPMTP